MADKFKKIDKEFLLTDSTVNSYGFRLLTSGYLRSEFEKNPVGYYMHGTSDNNHPREEGVLVTWSDFRQDGDKIFAKPTINLTHPRGQRTIDEIESGFLNAASLGHFVVLETSDDPALKLPNQTGPTVTKWYNRECSLVDIPGNYNALKLYDHNGDEINLSHFSTNNKQNMIQVTLSAQQLAALNLKAGADNAAALIAIDALVAKASQVDGLTEKLNAVTIEKTTAENALKALKAESVKTEVKAILKDGLAAKKLTVELSGKLEADYAGNPTALKALVDAIPAYVSISKSLENETNEAKDLAAKTWAELDESGQLEDLKASDPEMFKQKYKAEFKTEFKD